MMPIGDKVQCTCGCDIFNKTEKFNIIAKPCREFIDEIDFMYQIAMVYWECDKCKKKYTWGEIESMYKEGK